MMCMYSSKWMHDHIYSSKLSLGLVLLGKVCPWLHLLALGHLKRQVTNRNHPIRVALVTHGDPGKKGKKIITGQN